MKNYVTDADQRIPDLLIKITFLEKVETVIKSRFNIMGFSTNEAILGLYFIYFFHLNSRKSRNQDYAYKILTRCFLILNNFCIPAS